MCLKDVYTNEEFWKQIPYPDSPDNDAYDIGTTPYYQGHDGNWYREDLFDDDDN